MPEMIGHLAPPPVPLEEQQRRMRKLRVQICEQKIYRWAGKVLSTLFQFEFQEA